MGCAPAAPLGAAPLRSHLQSEKRRGPGGETHWFCFWSELVFLSASCWNGHVWLAGPVAHIACPCVLHRRAATLCSSLHPQGLYRLLLAVLGLSPLEAPYAVEKKALLPNWSWRGSGWGWRAGVSSSSSGTAASLSRVHRSWGLLALD